MKLVNYPILAQVVTGVKSGKTGVDYYVGNVKYMSSEKLLFLIVEE